MSAQPEDVMQPQGRRWTPFEKMAVLLLAAIVALLAYLAIREEPGDRLLGAIEKSLEDGGPPPGTAERARWVAARSDVNNLYQALRLYRLDNGSYPTTAQGLRALVQRPAGADPKKWQAYLDRLPEDPWRRQYQYANPGEAMDVDVFTLGPDGVPGTGDDIVHRQSN